MDLEIRSPQPYDLVGGIAVGREHVPVAFVLYGSGTSLLVRLVDGNGAELARQLVHAAGSGELGGPFAFELVLAAAPTTTTGTLEFGGTATTPPVQVVPVVFGSAVMPGYFTYVRREVVAGDSLFAIAEEQYKMGAEWPFIHQANLHQIADPALIYAGQVLNVPHSTTTVFHR